MRSFLVAFTSLMLFASTAAQARVAITIDKDNQRMIVAVDGVERYHWPVSTGIPSRETPSGSFRAFRMEEDHFSKEFDDAPMPHSIFFTKIGHAIHGTDWVGRLGTPASHGCVRLSKANASTLYALVQEQGVAQVRADDGYIYPADGSSSEARYPAPPSRRVYDTQVYQQPQQQYYGNRGYAPAPQPQGTYYQPRPQYQPRGLFTYQD